MTDLEARLQVKVESALCHLNTACMADEVINHHPAVGKAIDLLLATRPLFRAAQGKGSR